MYTLLDGLVCEAYVSFPFYEKKVKLVVMAILPIIKAPDPVLKKKCEKVERVDNEIQQLMDDMLATMYAAPGVGLAAPQVSILKRIIVIDVAKQDEKPNPLKIINPEIIEASEELATYDEGCLSFPTHYVQIGRSARVHAETRGRTRARRPTSPFSLSCRKRHSGGISIGKMTRDLGTYSPCRFSRSTSYECAADLRVFDLSHASRTGICLTKRFISYSPPNDAGCSLDVHHWPPGLRRRRRVLPRCQHPELPLPCPWHHGPGSACAW